MTKMHYYHHHRSASFNCRETAVEDFLSSCASRLSLPLPGLLGQGIGAAALKELESYEAALFEKVVEDSGTDSSTASFSYGTAEEEKLEGTYPKGCHKEEYRATVHRTLQQDQAATPDATGTSYTSSNIEIAVLQSCRAFYQEHSEMIDESHGWDHVYAVYHHAVCAISCHQPALTENQALQVTIAALLHDADDHKYFPESYDMQTGRNQCFNARFIMGRAGVLDHDLQRGVVEMIQLVSCSSNGNNVPSHVVSSTDQYYKLIPRWADRLEAVGAKGVVRCYLYAQEVGDPLYSEDTPRPQSTAEVWEHASPDRFEEYQGRGGGSTDMLSHYYNCLLHIASPPPEASGNAYLMDAMMDCSTILVQICLHYGKTGSLDQTFFR